MHDRASDGKRLAERPVDVRLTPAEKGLKWKITDIPYVMRYMTAHRKGDITMKLEKLRSTPSELFHRRVKFMTRSGRCVNHTGGKSL